MGGISSIYNNIMNGSKKKYIGINQRIPLEVLERSIDKYLASGTIDKEEIIAGIKSVTTGSNRANKAATYAWQVIHRQTKILGQISTLYSSLKPFRSDEKKALCACLVCLTYPIVYDLLTAMAQGLKVQEVVNKKFITAKVSALYGSNRTVDVAMDAIIPMLVELGMIERRKLGFYALGKKLIVKNPLLLEIVAYTDASAQRTKTLLMDNLTQKPWYTYFDIEETDFAKPSIFFRRNDSYMGMGYLTVAKLE